MYAHPIQAMHQIPGGDAISNFHDDMLDRIYLSSEKLNGGDFYTDVPWHTNVFTMPFSAAAVYADIGFQALEYYPWFHY